MTSDKEQTQSFADDDSSVMFGEDAVAMVAAGYRSITDHFKGVKERGIYPAGIILKEVIHELHSVPPLLSFAGFADFRTATQLDVYDDAVVGILHILRNHCNEKRLRPRLTIDENEYRLEVTLY